MKVLPRKKQYHCSFREARKILRKNDFTEVFWVSSGKSKWENLNHETVDFEIAIYRVLR